MPRDAHSQGARLDAYPRPSVATDLAVLTLRTVAREGEGGRPRLPEYRPQVLLVCRGEPPFRGSWALPGGFLREDEPAEAAARRELEEETNVADIPLRMLGVYSEAGRDPRGWVISVAYCALLPPALRSEPRGGSDATMARWWDVMEVESLPLAFDHGKILADARRWVQRQVLESLAAREFLPPSFTLAELYGVVQAIASGYDTEPVNFRRKVLARGIVESTGEREARYSRRAAELFRFTGQVPDLSVF